MKSKLKYLLYVVALLLSLFGLGFIISYFCGYRLIIPAEKVTLDVEFAKFIVTLFGIFITVMITVYNLKATAEMQRETDIRKMKQQYYHTFIEVYTDRSDFANKLAQLNQKLICSENNEKKKIINDEIAKILSKEKFGNGIIERRKFVIECNRLTLYASKEVVEFIEETKKAGFNNDINKENSYDLVKFMNLMRKDIFSDENEEVKASLMLY